MQDNANGVLAMLAACFIWGLSPLFYIHLAHIPPLEVLTHRTVWSLVTFGLVLALQRRLMEVPRAMGSGRRFGLTALSAAMISVNWFLFIYAVSVGRTVESSLGYYIFPLVAVAIGAILLREPLGPGQKLAVGLATLAVALLTWGLGVAPWISLALALTFGVYGLLKRWVESGPVVSVTAEVTVFLPFALAYLWWIGDAGAFGHERMDTLLLIAAGPITATPLILFSYAAKRVRMATVGVLQYVNPTLQFLCAALILGEAITLWHGITFPIIWAALAIYSWESFRPRSNAP